MTFIPNSEPDDDNLFVIIKDIEVLSGVFKRGTILRKAGNSGMRGDNFIDFEGNKLLETALCADSIVPLKSAYLLFQSIK